MDTRYLICISHVTGVVTGAFIGSEGVYSYVHVLHGWTIRNLAAKSLDLITFVRWDEITLT